MKKLMNMKKDREEEEKKKKIKENEEHFMEEHKKKTAWQMFKHSSIEDWHEERSVFTTQILQKQLSEMKGNNPAIKFIFPKPNDILHFILCITAENGAYNGGKFYFVITIPSSYPYDSPQVQLESRIFHPCFDEEGHHCLSAIENWIPTKLIGELGTTLKSVLENPEVAKNDFLNIKASEMCEKNPQEFEKVAKEIVAHQKSDTEMIGLLTQALKTRDIHESSDSYRSLQNSNTSLSYLHLNHSTDSDDELEVELPPSSNWKQGKGVSKG